MRTGLPHLSFPTSVRFTLTFIVWGLGIFIIFSISPWQREMMFQQMSHQASPYEKPLENWLAELTTPLDRIASDNRLKLGLALPQNLQSTPVRRALTEMATYYTLPEAYLVDTQSEAVIHTPNASPLPDALTPRLKGLSAHGNTHTLIGIGKKSGLVYVGRKLDDAPEGMDIWAIINLTIPQMATNFPELPRSKSQMLGLIMPHTDGIAFWDPDKAELNLPSPLQLQADKLVADASFAYQDDSRMAAVIPLRQWNGVSISVSMPLGDVPSGAGLKLCTLLLAILSTLAVWASSAAAPVVKIRNRLASLANTIAHKLKLDTAQKNLVERARRMKDEKPDLAWERKPSSTGTSEGVDFKDFGASPPKDSPSSAEPHTSDRSPPDLQEKQSLPKKKKGWKASSSFVPLLQALSTPAEPDKPATNLDKADLKTIVETCIREGRIMLHYQPIFRMDDSMPVLHEVFARLIHPNGSLIMPGQFMPLIAHHSLSLELDLAVFRKVQMTHFNTSAGPLTPLALNISSTSLDGLDYMTEMSKKTPQILSKLAFEVRSQEMARDNRALKLIKQIQRHGGNLAVDYFGGGSSMIKASKEVGFDYIKLDMGILLRKDPTGEDIKELCQAARSVGLPVILEKVGDMDSEIVARKSGAPYIQGYSLAVPGPSLNISPLPPRMTGIAAIVNNTITE